MSNKKRPFISGTDMRPRNADAKCRCGTLADRKVCIQVSWFRGEDEVVWSCTAHAKDPDYLLGVDA